MEATKRDVLLEDCSKGMVTTFCRDLLGTRSQATTERAERLLLGGKEPLCHVPGRCILAIGPPDNGLVLQGSVRERVLLRGGTGIHLQAPKAYVIEMAELLGLHHGKSVRTTGTTTPPKKQEGDMLVGLRRMPSALQPCRRQATVVGATCRRSSVGHYSLPLKTTTTPNRSTPFAA